LPPERACRHPHDFNKIDDAPARRRIEDGQANRIPVGPDARRA